MVEINCLRFDLRNPASLNLIVSNKDKRHRTSAKSRGPYSQWSSLLCSTIG